jgi:hypothetical protein
VVQQSTALRLPEFPLPIREIREIRGSSKLADDMVPVENRQAEDRIPIQGGFFPLTVTPKALP